MAIIYKNPRRPIGDLFQELLSPANVNNFSNDIGNSVGKYFQQQQELKHRQAMMQQDFQQQQALQEAKERARAQQGAAFANLFQSPSVEPGSNRSQASNEDLGETTENDFGSRKWEDIAAEAGKSGLFGSKEMSDLRKQWIEEKKHLENKGIQNRDFEFKKELVEKRREERAEDLAEKRGENVKRHEEKSRESKISEEKDQRKFDTEESNKLIKEGENAEKTIKQFKSIKLLSKDPKASVGVAQQVLNFLGLGKLNASSATQALAKLTSDVINNDPNSKGGIAMRNAIEKGQITPEMNQDTISFMSDFYTLENQKKVLLKDEIQKIMKESRKKGEKNPLNIAEIARENIKDKWDTIGDEQLGLVNSFTENPEQQSAEGITIPQGAEVGDIMTNPDTKEKVIYLGPKMGVRDLKEYQGALKELDSDLPPSQNKGRKIVNDELNLAFVSDGKSWKPLE